MRTVVAALTIFLSTSITAHAETNAKPITTALPEGYCAFQSTELREAARTVALEGGIPCLQGVFAAVPGPSLPTRAEYRAYRAPTPMFVPRLGLATQTEQPVAKTEAAA